MWCIGVLTAEYRQRMYDLLELYARPFRADEPVVCVDEKSKQLLRDSRAAVADGARAPARGTTNTSAPAPATCSWRWNPRWATDHAVTERRAKIDFVAFRPAPARTRLPLSPAHPSGARQPQHPLSRMLRGRARAQRGRHLLRRVVFHYTPKHASWLNMAEIEIGILDRQCLNRRMPINRRSSAKSPLGSSAATPSTRHRVDVHSAGADRKLGAIMFRN